MKKRTLLAFVLLFAAFASGCDDDKTSNEEGGGGQNLDRVEFVKQAGDIIFSVGGYENIKKGSAIDGKASLSFNYTNGYAREARITVTEIHECINVDITETLAAGKEQGSISIPLQGTPTEEGETEVTVTIMIDGSSVAVETYNITVLDEAGTLPVLVFGDLTSTGTFIKDVELVDTYLTLPYTGAVSQKCTVAVAAVNGVSSASQSLTLVSGDGSIDLPLIGTPTKAGDLNLVVTITPEDGEATTKAITLEVGIQDPLTFSAATIEGKIVETVAVANYTVTLNYTKGMNRVVTPTVTLSGDSGLTAVIADLSDNKLTLSEGDGTISVTVTGANPVMGTYECSISFAYDGAGYPAVATFDIVVEEKFAAEFDFAKSSITGTPLVNNGLIASNETFLSIPYTKGWGEVVNITVSGLATSAAADYTLIAGDGAGVVKIPLSGTPAAELGALTVTVSSFENIIENVFAGEKVTFNNLNYYTVFVDLNSDNVIDAGERWLDRNLGATSNDPGQRGDYQQNPNAVGNYYHYGINTPVTLEDAIKNGKTYKFAPFTSGYSYPDDMNWVICPAGYRIPTRAEFGKVAEKYLGVVWDTGNLYYNAHKYAQGKDTQLVMNAPLRFAMGGLMIAKTAATHNDVPGVQTAFWTSSLLDNDSTVARIYFQGDQADIGNTSDLRANVRCLKN